jgi:hypothetical protein
MKIFVVLLALASAWAQAGAPPADAVQSCERKLRYIEQNGHRPQPDQTPTQLSEPEVNAYFAAGRVKLPTGVHNVRFESAPNLITTLALVDFDEITAGRRSANPLLSLFSGRHDVRVVARASGSGGQGVVNVESVFIDEVKVPRVALEFFVDRYVRPKYPDLGLDSRFKLPARIDMAIVGEHKVTVTQK